jgi:hypothetical protein
VREDVGESGVEDAGDEDDREEDEESGDLASAELFGNDVLSLLLGHVFSYSVRIQTAQANDG